jgi:hypothetical protein
MLSLDAIRSPGVCSRDASKTARDHQSRDVGVGSSCGPRDAARRRWPERASDNADFDDLIVSITSPTAGVTAVLVQVAAPWSLAVDAVVLAPPGSVCSVVSSSVESRAPPLT